MKRCMVIVLVLVLLGSCASTGSGDRLFLLDAIQESVEKMAIKIPLGSRVAIASFESPRASISDYIADELTGMLNRRGIEVADWQNMEYVYRELDLQMTKDISDETALAIGKFLGAQAVIIGTFYEDGPHVSLPGQSGRCKTGCPFRSEPVSDTQQQVNAAQH